MINVSLEALWKIVVVALLAAIVWFGYRIDKDLQHTYIYQVPVGCGIYGSSGGGSGVMSATPLYCAQPLPAQSTPSTKAKTN